MSTSTDWTPEKYIDTLHQILRRSTHDRAFRRQALADADATLESVGGLPVPADKRGQTKFLEQPGETGHVLPPFGSEFDPSQLSDAELENVAGGGSPYCIFTKGCYCIFTK